MGRDVRLEFVHPVMLYVYPSRTLLYPITSEVRVGTMYNFPSSTNELFDDAVVISNSPLLGSLMSICARGNVNK